MQLTVLRTTGSSGTTGVRGAVPASIRAAVLRSKGGPFRLETVDLARPRPDEVVVRLAGTGVCHTDIAVAAGRLPFKLPIVLGHEGSGVVVATGSAVTRISLGDAVVMSYLSCGVCRECATGLEANCGRLGALSFAGGRPDGSHALRDTAGEWLNDRFFDQSSFASFAIANERNAIKVPDDLPLRLLGPLGCGIMTGAGAIWNELQKGEGACAIFSAGAVGLSAIMAARLAGASRIVAVDRIPSRLQLARSLGATHTIDASNGDVLENLKQQVPEGIDRALDTTGRAAVVEVASRSLRQRGSLALVAAADPEMRFKIGEFLAGSRTVRGVIEGGGSSHTMIPRLIELHRQGLFPFDSLVRFYPPEQLNAAIQDSVAGSLVKPVVEWPEQA